MQCLEVSGAVGPIYGSLGVKRLNLWRNTVIVTSSYPTNSIYQSQSWKCIPEGLHIYWNPRFITVFATARQLPLLSEMTLIHAFPFYFSIILYNFMLPSLSMSSQTSLSFRCLHQNTSAVLSHSCYIPCSTLSTPCDHLNNFLWLIQIVQFIMQFTPISCYLTPLSPKCLSQHPIFEHP